jgi:hypothetical protein
MTDPKWTDALLDEMRTRADPRADEAVNQLFSDGSIPTVNELFRTLVRNDSVPAGELPIPLRAYREDLDGMPPWADLEQIRRGQDFFMRNGVLMVTALFTASLPLCYMSAKGVKVLYLTSRLETDATRRIVETAQLVIDTMAPGGLEAAGIRPGTRRSTRRISRAR